MFWVCGQEDEAVPRELSRRHFSASSTTAQGRGEIAIHWDDWAKRVATNIPEFQTEAYILGSHASCLQGHPFPHWFLAYPLSLGAKSFHQNDTGILQAVRGILCSVQSTQPRRQARGESQPQSPNPIWQLAFSFLVASSSLLFLHSPVHYTIPDDERKLKLLVSLNYVEGFAFLCFTLKKIQKLLQRQETHTEYIQ